MSSWLPLKKGDIVDVIAPGWATEQGTLKAGLKSLKSWGVTPRISPQLITKKHPYLAQSDEYRFRDLKNALMARDSAAVWCLRGGYGSLRLIPQLSRLKSPVRPKLLIGYSDISSLHIFLNQFWKWPSLHAPLVDRLGEGNMTPDEVVELKRTLFGEVQSLTYRELKPLNKPAQVATKRIVGRLTGGNLTVVNSSLGTPWQVQGEGHILFFEDAGERGYRVDRMLVQMTQAGLFSKCRAVVFGDFTGGAEKDGRFLWPHAIEEFAASVRIPVLSGVSAGHKIPNRPVPFGTYAQLTLGKKGLLEVETGVSTN